MNFSVSNHKLTKSHSNCSSPFAMHRVNHRNVHRPNVETFFCERFRQFFFSFSYQSLSFTQEMVNCATGLSPSFGDCMPKSPAKINWNEHAAGRECVRCAGHHLMATRIGYTIHSAQQCQLRVSIWDYALFRCIHLNCIGPKNVFVRLG